MTEVEAFDPFAPPLRAEPYGSYERLRRADPVHWSVARGLWIVTRHADATSLLADPRLAHWQMPGTPGGGELERILSRWLALMDPANHSRLRALSARLLAPSRMAALRQRIDSAAHRLLDLPARERDLVSGFADPLTLAVVASLLGVPAAERDRFAGLAARLRGSLFAVLAGRRLGDDADDAAAELSALLLSLLDGKAGEPDDDLLSALFNARQNDALDPEDFVALALVFLFAGHENATNFISLAMAALLAHPAAYERLAGDPGLLPLAVEELLRFDSPVQFVSLTVREELGLRGRRLGVGQQVLVGIGAANRDPEAFAHPDQLDVARAPNPHLTFGHGPFFCIGAGLARLEAEVALAVLLKRLESPRCAEPALRWRNGPPVLRGLISLRVRSGSAPRAAAEIKPLESGATV